MTTSQALVADRYRLVRPLGSGGMGRVWLAEDRVLHREVAIKEVIPPEGLTPGERDELRKRTLREARAAARLSHPNVVRIYDVVRGEQQPWIVMEYVPSRSLHEVVNEDGPLPPERAASIGLSVLAALQAAHRAGVLHRDVKPANVLLAEDGRVVLGDFGLATFEGGEGTVTRPGLILGSPQYIAPERAREGVSLAESDMWSLGATLYAAVEGRSPYARSTAIATLTALATEDPDPMTRAGSLKPVLNALLRKDPRSRARPAEVERMLQRCVSGADRRIRTRLLPSQRRGREAQKTTLLTGLAGAVGALPAGSPPAASPGPSTPPADSAATAVLAQPDVPPGQRGAPPTDAPLAPPPAADPSADGGTAPPQPENQDGAGQKATDPDSADQTVGAAVAAGAAVVAARGRELAVRSTGRALVRRPASQPRRTEDLRRAVAVGAALLIAAALVLVVLTGLREYRSEARARPVPAPSSTAAAVGPAASPTEPVTQSTSPAPPPVDPGPSVVAPAPPPAGGPPAGQFTLPAGWNYHQDPTGFRVAVPTGWQVTRTGTMVYFNDPNGGRRLGIDQTNRPKPDPVADWRDQEARRVAGGDFPQYAHVKIVPVSYWTKCADWEYTYASGGTRLHVLNRGFITSPTQAYAIFWLTRDADWARNLPNFDVIAASFRPAGS